jgi:hypothetical protein
MRTPCASPILWEVLVEYWAKETPPGELDALELHLLSCSECSAASARVAAITETIRGFIPPVIDSGRLADLRARGLRILENPVRRDERREVFFPRDVDILLHRLGGLDLRDALVVGMRVLQEGTGDTLLDLEDVPFDRDQGEVLVACQQHFSVLPHDVLFEVSAHQRSGAVDLVRYAVPHRFAS